MPRRGNVRIIGIYVCYGRHACPIFSKRLKNTLFTLSRFRNAHTIKIWLKNANTFTFQLRETRAWFCNSPRVSIRILYNQIESFTCLSGFPSGQDSCVSREGRPKSAERAYRVNRVFNGAHWERRPILRARESAMNPLHCGRSRNAVFVL